jgi:lipoprotein signal peptidase
MFTNLINITLIYIIVSLIISFIYYFFLKKKNSKTAFKTVFLICLTGVYIGGAADYIFKDLFLFLSNINGAVNIFPSLIAAGFFLWLTDSRSTDDE